MIKEFKEFIARGNVIDMAVGVIIGGAFGKIVTSIVNDVLMPLIGVVSGGIDFTGLKFKIGEAEILYGNFLQNVIDFLIIAFCIFILVKIVNKITRKKEEPAEETPAPRAEDVVLLEEIRDLLKQKEEV
ncbi:MAG: large-conductance mechanosensitive channel protein MscL [Clostridia bacterium]|nr:large-conductance mechanosensitive channel protein MscL [Clostridia bacterium]